MCIGFTIYMKNMTQNLILSSIFVVIFTVEEVISDNMFFVFFLQFPHD